MRLIKRLQEKGKDLIQRLLTAPAALRVSLLLFAGGVYFTDGIFALLAAIILFSVLGALYSLVGQIKGKNKALRFIIFMIQALVFGLAWVLLTTGIFGFSGFGLGFWHVFGIVIVASCINRIIRTIKAAETTEN